MPERFVIALRQNMVIAWSDQNDYTDWTPAADNLAGSRNVTEGTKLVGARSLGGAVALIWSDSALYIHQFTGTEFVFDTRIAGKNCGLISPSAAVVVGGAAYWMSHNTFFVFAGGAVQPIPNVENVRSHIFDQLDVASGYLMTALYCPKFNEVWFFISVQASEEPSIYAIVSLFDFSWVVGMLERVGGTYFSHGDTRPYWAKSDGHIYLQEEGFNDDGVAIDAFCTLAPSGIEKGKKLMDIEGIEPDFHEQAGNVTLTINTWDRIRAASDAVLDTQANTVAPTDTLVDLRVSGRYAGMTVRSNTLDGYFRLGAPTLYVKESGSRR